MAVMLAISKVSCRLQIPQKWYNSFIFHVIAFKLRRKGKNKTHHTSYLCFVGSCLIISSK